MGDPEITLRSLGNNKFILIGRWVDVKDEAKIEFVVDPKLLSVSALFDLVENARKEGEKS